MAMTIGVDNVRTLSTLGTEESYSPASSPARSMRLASATPKIGGGLDFGRQMVLEPVANQPRIKIERVSSVPALQDGFGSALANGDAKAITPSYGGQSGRSLADMSPARLATLPSEPVTRQASGLPISPMKAEPVVKYLGTTLGQPRLPRGGSCSPIRGSSTPLPPFITGVAASSMQQLGALGDSPLKSRLSVSSPPRAFPFHVNPDADPLAAFASQVSAAVAATQDVLGASGRPISLPVSLPRAVGQPAANELLPSTGFKFYKDYALESRLALDNTDSAMALNSASASVGSLPVLPAPSVSAALQAAAVHEQRVEELSRQPPTMSNIETQIQELLEGQEAIRYELNQVKLQANSNFNELEQLRFQAQQSSMGHAYPQPASSMPAEQQEQRLPSPPAYTMPQRELTPASPQSAPVATQSVAPTGLPLDSNNNVLRNLGYHVNHDHFTSLHETLTTHGSNALATAHGHTTNALNFVSEKAKSKSEGKSFGCV